MTEPRDDFAVPKTRRIALAILSRGGTDDPNPSDMAVSESMIQRYGAGREAEALDRAAEIDFGDIAAEVVPMNSEAAGEIEHRCFDAIRALKGKS